MKRFLLLLTMAIVVVGLSAQTKAATHYDGQPMLIHFTSGESLYTELASFGGGPRLKDGKIVWRFDNSRGYDIEDVESVEFITHEQMEAEARKALIDFYNATDGDHWKNNTNWCSDKPLDEWFGIDTYGKSYPSLINLESNNLKGQIPNDFFSRVGPVSFFNVSQNGLSGPICDLSKAFDMQVMLLARNQLTGELLPEFFNYPKLVHFECSDNNMTGPIPASLAHHMDLRNAIDISGNDFSGKVPDEIVNHPRFHLIWNDIIPQRGHLELPTIPGYQLTVEDLAGNKVNTEDIYKNNLYTLVFNYSSAASSFSDKLKKVYEQYKDKGFEVLGMAPGNAEVINEYLHANNISWMNLDPESFVEAIGKYYIYLNFINLVDQNGNVVFTSIMDETGKMEDTWGGSTRDQKVFDVLAEKFGQVDFTPYTSTDFSRDGEVMTLQKATVGQGVDIVFVGNAFVDKDMEPGGKYEQKMNEAMEQFFAYEPYTSLRDRFNVYAVKAVSRNAEMFEGCKQAIETNADAFNYASKVTTLIPDRPMRVNIIFNSYNAGRSFTTMYDDNSYTAHMLSGVNRLLNHEGGGHGIGRLYDEYVEDAGTTASQETKDYYERMWTENGRGANIDMHADVSQTRWARLAADSRYASENLGAFEGSGTYSYGIYRPTQNSMMRFNDTPFNAPSREAIYKYVMQESEGPNWTYDYETFVAFDAAGRKQFADASNANKARGEKAPKQPSQFTAPPVFKKGTWRDALNNRDK
jgi:hypothetical protein